MALGCSGLNRYSDLGYLNSAFLLPRCTKRQPAGVVGWRGLGVTTAELDGPEHGDLELPVLVNANDTSVPGCSRCSNLQATGCWRQTNHTNAGFAGRWLGTDERVDAWRTCGRRARTAIVP